MNYYFFTTPEGQTFAPNGELVYNFQLLGFALGKNIEEALFALLQDNDWIEENDYNLEQIKAHKLALDTVLP